jgi:hypothetical protein
MNARYDAMRNRLTIGWKFELRSERTMLALDESLEALIGRPSGAAPVQAMFAAVGVLLCGVGASLQKPVSSGVCVK